MNPLLDSFLAAAAPSLKICGVTTPGDATQLAGLGVHALGVNFWPESRRYCPPDSARQFLPALKDRILRVGVFVNADPDLPCRLLADDLIDVVQLHGDEDLAYCHAFAAKDLPFFKAIGVAKDSDLDPALQCPANGVLLDTHAPGVYGGTGQVIDWKSVARFIDRQSPPPLILAGGITPQNAAEALHTARVCALDVASGAESSPGIKDFEKVAALLTAVRSSSSNAN